MKDIRAIKGKYYLHRLIAEGEHEHQDFKFRISDARKIARSISAFANNSGGRLLIGVKDNGVIAGVRNEEDIYLIEQAAQMYCNPAQTPEFSAYKAEEGAVVIIAEIAASPCRPVRVAESDGSQRAYYRVADENIVASPLMVKAWRRKASERPAVFTLSESEKQLIDMLADGRGVTLEEITANCMVSTAGAENMILNLYTMGAVDFRFINRQFCIVSV